MKKPQPRKREIFDYHEMRDFIDQKYGIKSEAYHDTFYKDRLQGKSTYTFNGELEAAWHKANSPAYAKFFEPPLLPNRSVNQEGMDTINTPVGRKISIDAIIAYNIAPDGKCMELKYMDFWGFVLDDVLYGECDNPSVHTFNWAEIKEEAKEQWQKDICDMYIAEFGDKDMEVEISR